MWNHYSAALLPVGDRVNPRNPDKDYWLYEQGMVAYVMVKMAPYSTTRESISDKGKKTYRVFTSHGDLSETWAVDTVHEVHHDQTLRNQGFWKVVGIAQWTAHGAMVEGDVPDRRVAHSVFK